MDKFENGESPPGAVCVCASMSQACRLQALAKAHSIKKDLLLIARFVEDASENAVGAKQIVPPWVGNLALVIATVAVLNGDVLQVEGEQMQERSHELEALRMIVPWCVQSPDKIAALRTKPILALSFLQCPLKEAAVSGWQCQDETMRGYVSKGQC